MLIKKHNKYIALLLVIVLGITIALSPRLTFAESNPQKTEALSLNDIYKIYENNCDTISLISSEKNQLTYDVTNDTEDGEIIISHITASIDNNGQQTLDISENGKRDIVTIDSARNIYVDGQLVEIESLEGNEITESEIVPMGGHRIYWQKTAPYGKSSDYTKKSSTVKKKLTYTKPLKDATVGALVSLICIGLGLSSGGSLAVGFIASGVISWFGKNNPAGKAWSLKDVKYVHKNKGFNVKSSMSVYKHAFTYYGNTNYTGKIGSGTRFQVFAY